MPHPGIELRPSGNDTYTVIYPEPFTGLRDNETIASLQSIVEREPYNLPAVLELARQLFETEKVEDSCQIHFGGCQLAIEALPEEEEDIMPVDWEESEENQAFATIFGATGIDCYHFGDFEMAAGLFESALDLDPEDHYHITSLLAYCYIMLGEWELLDEVLFDIPKDSMDWELITAMSMYKKGENPDLESFLSKDILDELRAVEHPELANNAGSLSKSEQARLLWFRAQPALLSMPDFLVTDK